MRLILALAALVALTVPAQAGFSVCNKSTRTVRVAVGSFDGTHWGSQGWWFVTPNHCTAVIPGKLDSRYYYLYATNENFGLWDGTKKFCVTVFMKFSITGRANCESRGYYRLGFFEVDTGDRLDWVQTIADPR
jgi:uncharacterized membrane protein